MRATTRNSRPIEAFFVETAFGGFTHVDGAMAFYLRVDSLLSPDDVVLDVGSAGALWAAKAPQALQGTLFAFGRKSSRPSSPAPQT